MIVRSLTEADAGHSRELRLRALREHPEAFGATYEEEAQRPLEVTARRLSEMNDDNFVLGAFEGSQMVGMVVVFRQNGLKMRHKSHIYGMYVVPEMRGKGIGHTLLAEVIARCRALSDLEHLVLDVVPDNIQARNLYLSFGFRPFGREPAGLKLPDRYFDLEYMYLDLTQVNIA